MSIESTLSELTLAIRELTVALNASKTPAAPQEAAEKPAGKPTKAEKPVKTEPAASTPPAASTAPTAEAPATAPTPKAENSAPSVEYDRDIVPLFRQYAGKNREAALAFIKAYKPEAAKLSDAIVPAQYAEVLAKLKALLA